MSRATFVRERHGIVGRTTVQKALAIVGVAAPIVFAGIFITAGLIRPGYNPVKQYGSELEVGPYGWLQRANFVVFGLAEMAFAYGLHRGISGGKGSKVAPALLGLAGVAWVLIGLFPTGTTHYRAVKLLFYSWIAAYVILTLRLRSDTRWCGYTPYSLLAVALSCVLYVAYQWGDRFVPLAGWIGIGLVQRLLLAVTVGWLEILALRLLALSRDPEATRRADARPLPHHGAL